MEQPWRCAGCTEWNWAWRTSCRFCGPAASHIECSCIDDGDTTEYEEYFPATTGCIAPELVGKLPGYLSPCTGIKFADVLHGQAAISKEHVPITAPENEMSVRDPEVSWHLVGCKADDNVDHSERRHQTELEYGRVSMPATIGCITPELVGKLAGYLCPCTGIKYADALHGLAAISKRHVPITVFQYEMSVQNLEVSWDPVGCKADDNVDHSERRHQTELKYGRVSMPATIGCITPELVGKLPGYLSPCTGIKFADVLHGLAAISKEHVPITASENEVGVRDPEVSWHPVGCKADDNVDHSERQHQTELEHGRASKPATIGCITPELVGKLSGYLSPCMGIKFADVPHGLAAISKEHVPITVFQYEVSVQHPEVSWDLVGCKADDNVDHSDRRRQTELEHGIALMPATMGCITPELVGKLPGYLSPCTGIKFADVLHGLAAISKEHVPIAASENEVGVQDLEASWDLDGCKADDNVDHSERQHQTELEHGRALMPATIGCITPELVGKLPGYLSPCTGIKFADVSHGLAAISKEHVPITASENEVGVRDPEVSWDLVGCKADDNVDHSERRHRTELEHGRVKHGRSLMAASLDFITPERSGELPGTGLGSAARAPDGHILSSAD